MPQPIGVGGNAFGTVAACESNVCDACVCRKVVDVALGRDKSTS